MSSGKPSTEHERHKESHNTAGKVIDYIVFVIICYLLSLALQPSTKKRCLVM